MNQTDHLIIGSDNIISMTLTEDDSVIVETPTEITIKIGSVTITRSPTGNGVTYLAGVVEITPSGLTEDLSGLVVGRIYPVTILLKTASDTSGVLYGGGDSTNKQFFQISDV